MNLVQQTQRYRRVLGLCPKYYRRAKGEDRRGELTPERIRSHMFGFSGEVLDLLGVDLEVRGLEGVSQEPCFFVGNHISYLDIVLLMNTVAPHFVSKAEVRRWPLYGKAARLAGTVFVKRSSTGSRARALQSIAQQVLAQEKQVVIFPSGTTTLDENKPWRRGVFRLSKESGIPVRPFRIRYSPLRDTAYIDDDFFPTHLWRLSGQAGIQASIEFGKVLVVKDVDEDLVRTQAWTAQGLTRNS